MSVVSESGSASLVSTGIAGAGKSLDLAFKPTLEGSRGGKDGLTVDLPITTGGSLSCVRR